MNDEFDVEMNIPRIYWIFAIVLWSLFIVFGILLCILVGVLILEIGS